MLTLSMGTCDLNQIICYYMLYDMLLLTLLVKILVYKLEVHKT